MATVSAQQAWCVLPEGGPLLFMHTESEELELYNYMETSGGWVLQEDLDLQFLYAQKEKFLDMTMEVS